MALNTRSRLSTRRNKKARRPYLKDKRIKIKSEQIPDAELLLSAAVGDDDDDDESMRSVDSDDDAPKKVSRNRDDDDDSESDGELLVFILISQRV